MSTTLHRSFPIAARSHRCDDCGRPILKGERYHRWKGTADEWDGVATLKECPCCFARYSRHLYLSDENRAVAEAWMVAVALPSREETS